MKKFAVFVSIGLFVASCSGSESSPTPPSLSVTTVVEIEPTTTEKPDAIPEIAEATRPTLEIPDSDTYTDEIEEIKERYFLYLEAQFYAAAPPIVDPNYEPLQGLVTGKRAEAVREYLEDWRDEDLVRVVKDPDSLTTAVAFPTRQTFPKVEGATIVFQDCYVDTSELQVRSTGEVIASGTVTNLVNVEMAYTEGEWRVSGQSREAKYEGESECPDRL